jgi:spermidine/putrescine transport system permease protein
VSSAAAKRGPGLKIYGILIYLFLYFPMAIVLIFSFSPTKTLVGMQGVTLKWYQDLFRDENLLNAFLHTVIIGLSSVAIAVALGISGAFFVTKVRFPGKSVFRTLVLLPYVLPGIIMGISLLIFIRNLNIRLSWFTVLLGHVSFTVPIVMFQIMSRIARMGPNYQSAAMDLGANPVQTFWHVTLPMIKTAIIGAALLAFTV